MTAHPLHPSSRQHGFALFMGLIFLLMITLVAVTAMRGTSLELNMANNTANFEESFEGAESARMATVRIIRDHVACNFRWPQGAQLTGSSGGACRVGTCTGGDGGDGNNSTMNYPWEPRLTINDSDLKMDFKAPGEVPNDPSSYVDRLNMKFGINNTGNADVGTYMVSSAVDRGTGALQNTGYEGASGSGASGGGSRYFDVSSQGEITGARANVGGHYRLLIRETIGTCLSDLSFGAS